MRLICKVLLTNDQNLIPMSQGFDFILSKLNTQNRDALVAVKRKSAELLDRNPRFKYFTLHGEAHLSSLFDVFKLLIDGGITLTQEDLFVLSLAICTHDLGMVVALSDKQTDDLLDGKPQDTDPTLIEEFVRKTHHDLVALYYQQDFNFLTSLQISPQTVGLVREVSRMHRQIPLSARSGKIKTLGALLRVIDELDLSAARAPYTVLEAIYPDIDATSCWHWYKHNIVEGWSVSQNVFFNDLNSRKSIVFKLQVHPCSVKSIPYWLNQVRRPIHKALDDDGAASIVLESFGVKISVETDSESSYPSDFGPHWRNIEDRALSSGLPVVVVIDDEHRKIEDLFLPLMDRYYVMMAYNAKDAFTKLEAKQAALAIVDMQVPSGGRYTSNETEDYKCTGKLICRDLRSQFPQTKVLILTATKHPLPDFDTYAPDKILAKPIHPDELETVVDSLIK